MWHFNPISYEICCQNNLCANSNEYFERKVTISLLNGDKKRKMSLRFRFLAFSFPLSKHTKRISGSKYVYVNWTSKVVEKKPASINQMCSCTLECFLPSRHFHISGQFRMIFSLQILFRSFLLVLFFSGHNETAYVFDILIDYTGFISPYVVP